MTSISRVEQIVAVIRQQFARLERAQGGASEPARVGRDRTVPGDVSQDLLKLLGRRIRAIDPADPDRGRKAFRLFLESALLSELGESLMNDPQFYRLVDDVQREMESDPRLRDSIDQAVRQLLADVR